LGRGNSAEGRALVNPLLIFPYRVIKCVTIAKTKVIASSKYLLMRCVRILFFLGKEGDFGKVNL
jgi:hypothetical protein